MNLDEFILFVEKLKKDYLDNKENWENNSIDLYLDAIVAYSRDIQGFYNNTNQKIDIKEVDWKVFADVLKGAKIYE